MTAKIKLNAASGGGSFSLQAPSSSANNRVFTLPDITDTTLATTNGITEADQWRVTTNFTSQATTVENNWERNDTNFTLIGSGMTQSSGLFTFPTTGVYSVRFVACGYGSGSYIRYVGVVIQTTENNSTYSTRAENYNSIADDSSAYGGGMIELTYDVTNTSTHKVRFKVEAESSVTWNCSSAAQVLGATFVRLGDT
tara:strand:+ start:208 stop:798 length:591 start_codon:yes stop_codon:yes gene_type:complete